MTRHWHWCVTLLHACTNPPWYEAFFPPTAVQNVTLLDKAAQSLALFSLSFVRSCVATLAGLDLTGDSMIILQDLAFDLRTNCMFTLLKQAIAGGSCVWIFVCFCGNVRKQLYIIVNTVRRLCELLAGLF